MADKKRVAEYDSNGNQIGWKWVDATDTVATPVKTQEELDAKVKEQKDREAAAAKKPPVSPLLAASMAARKKKAAEPPPKEPDKKEPDKDEDDDL
jgi:hypothetical protein